MRTRTSVILAAIGAVVLALGIVYGPDQPGRTQQAAQGQLMFPDLVAKLADAAKVEIVHKGATLDLDRGGKDAAADWGVAARDGYPAQAGKVHELLAHLTELRLDEPRTAERRCMPGSASRIRARTRIPRWCACWTARAAPSRR